MLDIQAVARQPIPRIEVADYIEMGRLVAEWATEPATRPRDVAELTAQLDGIAVVPDRIRSVRVRRRARSTIWSCACRRGDDRGEHRADDRPDGRRPLSAAAVLRRPLPSGLRAGDDPARHPARAGRRPHHCPVPLRRRSGSRRKPCVRFASSLTTTWRLACPAALFPGFTIMSRRAAAVLLVLSGLLLLSGEHPEPASARGPRAEGAGGDPGGLNRASGEVLDEQQPLARRALPSPSLTIGREATWR